MDLASGDVADSKARIGPRHDAAARSRNALGALRRWSVREGKEKRSRDRDVLVLRKPRARELELGRRVDPRECPERYRYRGAAAPWTVVHMKGGTSSVMHRTRVQRLRLRREDGEPEGEDRRHDSGERCSMHDEERTEQIR
jgi:hypothetical protein